MTSNNAPPPLAREGVHEKAIHFLKERPRGKILDVPAGYGALSIKLHELGFQVSCCDINTDQFLVKELAIAKGDLNNRIPYSDGEFDYVCFLEGLEHTENPYNAVREVSRVLRPGGLLILSTPNYLNIERRLKFLVTGFFTKPVSPAGLAEGHIHGMHLSPIGYTLIRFAIEHAGLRIIEFSYDRKKPKQVFLKPLVWLIRLYGRLWTEKKRKQYWLAETTGDAILDGGNTLIIIAQKKEG